MKRLISDPKKKYRAVTALTFAALAITLPVRGSGSDDYTLSRHTIDGGGQVRCNGGTFELSGTIGQPDAGSMAGADFVLQAGFWFELSPTDCNEDGVVSLTDYIGFEACISGPGQPVLSGCECYDTNGNGTIDLGDIAAAQSAFSGQ